MYIRTWTKKDIIYASLVESIRDGNKVIQKTIIYFGIVDKQQVPFLKATFSNAKSTLIFNGITYEK